MTLTAQPNIVQIVCQRPRMYANGGTLAEILSLFAGYERGLIAHGASADDDSPARTIAWLHEQFACEPNPEDLAAMLIQRHGGEAEALAALAEFAATLKPTSRKTT